MLKMIFAISLTLFSAHSAFATQCPAFPYDLTEEDGVHELRYFAISAETQMTALQSNQVIQAAQRAARLSSEVEPQTLTAAIALLADGSEAGDITYRVIRFQSRVYTLVVYYPGGNSYGLIFDGETAIASLSDGDVACL